MQLRMQQQQLVQVRWDNRAQTIALFAGQEPEELRELLSSIFNISAKVLGFRVPEVRH